MSASLRAKQTKIEGDPVSSGRKAAESIRDDTLPIQSDELLKGNMTFCNNTPYSPRV